MLAAGGEFALTLTRCSTIWRRSCLRITARTQRVKSPRCRSNSTTVVAAPMSARTKISQVGTYPTRNSMKLPACHPQACGTGGQERYPGRGTERRRQPREQHTRRTATTVTGKVSMAERRPTTASPSLRSPTGLARFQLEPQKHVLSRVSAARCWEQPSRATNRGTRDRLLVSKALAHLPGPPAGQP